MSTTPTYTVYLPVDDIEKDDSVIARQLSAVEAMKIVFGHASGWRVHVHEEDYGSFGHYVWAAIPDKRPAARSFTERLHATVVRTGDAVRDRAVALDLIAAQCMRFNHLYWDCHSACNIGSDSFLMKFAGDCGSSRENRRHADGLSNFISSTEWFGV